MRIIIFLLATSVHACTSGKTLNGDHDGMDIVESASQQKSSKKLADPNRPITPDAVFNWQKFFKGPPAAKERIGLITAVKKAESASTSEELVIRGRNEFSLGLISSSESSFRQALRKDPKNIDAMIELAATLQRQRKTRGSFEVLANARSQLNQQITDCP